LWLSSGDQDDLMQNSENFIRPSVKWNCHIPDASAQVVTHGRSGRAICSS
jgi:hypothetical protein